MATPSGQIYSLPGPHMHVFTGIGQIYFYVIHRIINKYGKYVVAVDFHP